MRLFCDCKTDEEKSNFILSGRAVETGVIAPAISNDVAMAYHRCDEFKKEVDALRAKVAEMEQQEPVGWQPIETAPKDLFLLLCGPSGYTTTPLVFATGCMYSDYHVGRWVDHANDDLSDWGFEPTHWMPLPELPGAKGEEK